MKAAQANGMELVWVDWPCVPQVRAGCGWRNGVSGEMIGGMNGGIEGSMNGGRCILYEMVQRTRAAPEH